MIHEPLLSCIYLFNYFIFLKCCRTPFLFVQSFVLLFSVSFRFLLVQVFRIQGGGGSVCSGSPWEFSTTDEGYLTSKETELPEMIHSAWKELECPICMEVGIRENDQKENVLSLFSVGVVRLFISPSVLIISKPTLKCRLPSKFSNE